MFSCTEFQLSSANPLHLLFIFLMQQRATDYHSDRMSETSDKNGYHFPYTAEEDHLTMMSRNHSTTNDMNYPTLSKLASRHGSRGSSPPSVTGIQPLAPLTSITDTSEWVVIVFNFFFANFNKKNHMEHHHTEIIESSFLVHTCYIIRCHIGLDFVTLILSLFLCLLEEFCWLIRTQHSITIQFFNFFRLNFIKLHLSLSHTTF